MTYSIIRSVFSGLAMLVLAAVSLPAAQAQPAALVEGNGWIVKPTPHEFSVLVAKVEAAIAANKMGLVNFASASDGAKAQGITIPGNRVVGVFRNDYARRMLAASLPAGIEAPIRLYLTEAANGTSTLSYRSPSTVFGPYLAAAGPDLKTLAQELDPIFAKIVEDAVKP